MRIRTQFIITMLLFGAILIAISISAIITNQRVARANQQEKTAGSIAQGASELSYLANDYVIYRESQQLERWQTRFALFQQDVASLQSGTLEQHALVSNIQASSRRLKEVFDSVAAAVGGSTSGQGGAIDAATLQVSWSRMAVQSQGLASDAGRLSQLLRADADRWRRTNLIVIFTVIGMFAVYFATNFLLIQRRVLNSIARLRAGAAVIGSGNLDFRIKTKSRNDEITDLGNAFNQMAADLKTVTASKADVEREILRRNVVEEDLRVSNEHLQNQTLKLKIEVDGHKKAEQDLAQRTAELEAVNRELESFSYSVSHDLREPLRAIDGFSNILKKDYRDSLDTEGQRLLDTIISGASRMDRLITDLLAFSRLSRQPIGATRIDMLRLARDTCRELAAANTGRNLDFRVGPLPPARGDENLIRQVFINLLSNALKFTGPREIAVVQVAGSTRTTENVYHIRDNGVGFDMKYADKLFGVFQRLHSREQFEGSGVGLAIVQRIVQRHGGRVWAESNPGEGATFCFTLPGEEGDQ